MHGRDDDAAKPEAAPPPVAAPASPLLFERTDAELVEERLRVSAALTTMSRARVGFAACSGALALATGASAILLSRLEHDSGATPVVAVSVVISSTVSAVCTVQSLIGWFRPGVSERRSAYRLALISQIDALRTSRSS